MEPENLEPGRSLPYEIAEAIKRGATILTGNQRAARGLRLSYDRHCRRTGLTQWQPPSIFAWDTWTAQLWRQLTLEGHASRLLLNRTQELHVWRSVVSADSTLSSLRTADSLSALASDAWRLLCAYHGQFSLSRLNASEDTRTFLRWTNSFNLRCRSNAYLSASELESALVELSHRLPKKEILLVGFDTKTPAQLSLLEAISAAGSSVTDLPLAVSAGRVMLATAEDPDAELTECASRINAFLTEQPGAQVAVIHPNIESDRGEIDRVFREVLAPELNNIANTAGSPHEFSLGQSLAKAPIVAAAISILRFAVAPLPIEDLSRLLLSPWFTPTAELDARAEFDAHQIRTASLLHPWLNLDTIIRIAESSRHRDALEGLLRQLHKFSRAADRILSETTKQRSYADWADSIRDLLRAADWANFTRDTSVEFQTRRKWESALDELATLDFEGTRPVFIDALRSLEDILESTLFAPESNDAPVQIMSPQEAAGSRFDAIFFMRCSDLNWPPTQGTHPLLGWRLQRELRMPGTDPTLDNARAKTITDRLVSSAATITFSFAQRTKDASQRPSPLLLTLKTETDESAAKIAQRTSMSLEEVLEPASIPLVRTKVRGGSSVLKNQAACPFRAFAENRLASLPLDMPQAGFDAGERGSLIHATMAKFWSDVQSQAALRALSMNDRRATVDRAITHALERAVKLSGTADATWDAAYLDIQRSRLHRIVDLWLASELERAPFTIRALEQKFENLSFGPIELDVRIDRIDTLIDEDGDAAGDILLDYKTGDAMTKHWHGDRPDDPQLPLYAALSEPESLAGIGFIRLRPGTGMSLAGYASEEGLLLQSGLPETGSLEIQIEEWAKVLLSLATDFATGVAVVDPKTYPGTCSFCKQRILCRIDPHLLESDITEEDDESDTTAVTKESYG
jgi:ATP-dependent helicase/nuclease subunit B